MRSLNEHKEELNEFDQNKVLELKILAGLATVLFSTVAIIDFLDSPKKATAKVLKQYNREEVAGLMSTSAKRSMEKELIEIGESLNDDHKFLGNNDKLREILSEELSDLNKKYVLTEVSNFITKNPDYIISPKTAEDTSLTTAITQIATEQKLLPAHKIETAYNLSKYSKGISINEYLIKTGFKNIKKYKY